jgi:4'-phosphopantetheinyl transferase
VNPPPLDGLPGLRRLAVRASAPFALWLLDLRETPMHELDRAVLSRDELDRERGYRFHRDRHRFVARHVVLHALLAAAQDRDPRQYSLASSGDFVLYGLTPAGSIGVDIEIDHGEPATASLTRLALAPDERAALQALPPRARARRFLEYWTLKESLAKASRIGLTRPPAGFSIGPDPRTARLCAGPNWAELRRASYTAELVPEIGGCVAAVAMGHARDRFAHLSGTSSRRLVGLSLS